MRGKDCSVSISNQSGSGAGTLRQVPVSNTSVRDLLNKAILALKHKTPEKATSRVLVEKSKYRRVMQKRFSELSARAKIESFLSLRNRKVRFSDRQLRRDGEWLPRATP